MKKISSRSCRLCPGILMLDTVEGSTVSMFCPDCHCYKIILYHPSFILRQEGFRYNDIHVNVYYSNGIVDYYHAFMINKSQAPTNISKIFSGQEIQFNPLQPGNLISKIKTLMLFL